MSRSAQTRVSRTQDIPIPNAYISALLGEYREWAFDETRAPLNRGVWRSQIFGVEESVPMDLEIGTGNGTHFAQRALTEPGRMLVGIELKYKPLIQSIRRARNNGSENARIIRHNAALLSEIFSARELNDIFIFFPDPWSKNRQQKHRLINLKLLEMLFELQRPGTMIHFKTDSQPYYLWALEHFKKSPYKIVDHGPDLHGSKWAESNFKTQFENIFLRQGMKIAFAKLAKA